MGVAHHKKGESWYEVVKRLRYLAGLYGYRIESIKLIEIKLNDEEKQANVMEK